MIMCFRLMSLRSLRLCLLLRRMFGELDGWGLVLMMECESTLRIVHLIRPSVLLYTDYPS